MNGTATSDGGTAPALLTATNTVAPKAVVPVATPPSTTPPVKK
ncbi:MAG: hypothetical protein ABMA26_21180 [Limisphaerales bacterium]